MYESFYSFREKPFSLLPDSGFLYLSDQHRMALTLLEYGLMNQAGFTVISGDIGTGKTTLIRQLLNNIDPLTRVGLISNTHSTFGDLMQWIALAFELPHQGRDKVQLYQEFMDFIIGEYAQGRRTVLIIDEAQNMSAETLEELRMLSNVNADKDQVLQVILVGQRELRETLQRPELIQFAQRIGVDYHLEPLDQAETVEYIQHRCRIAGGDPDLFSKEAANAIFSFTGGVPRLINLLCDTVLVYGYATQRTQIDPELVNEVVRDKQRGGLFPTTRQAPASPASMPTVSARPRQVKDERTAAEDTAETAKPAPPARHCLRVAIAAESELVRIYLTRLLEKYDIEVTSSTGLNTEQLRKLDPDAVDMLLVELDDQPDRLDPSLYDLLENWKKPVLFNDSLATEASLSHPDREAYGRKLSEKLYSLLPHSPQSVA